MKVATIICNHNYGDYLPYAIESALSQTYPTAIFVADDNSTDNSREILESYKDRITYASIPQTVGPSEARNIIIDLAIKNGYEAIAILDADDYMYNNKIEICVNKLFSDEAIGAVYADYDIFDISTGNLIREYKEPFDRVRLTQECIVHSGAVIKSSVLTTIKNNNGYYNRTMRTCEDYELWARISKLYVISHIPESLTFVRNHNMNSTNTVNKAIWEDNWRKVAAVFAAG